MTESERLERIERLRQRRAGGAAAEPTPSPSEHSSMVTAPMTVEERERAERLARLAQRRSNTSIPVADTRPLSITPQPGSADAPVTASGPDNSRSRRRRTHKAEASRIASAGAGLALTFSLMSTMTASDSATAETIETPPQAPGDLIGAPTEPVSSQAPAVLSAATAPGRVPMVLVPVRVETRVVEGARPSTGSPVGGGSSVQAPAPPPPPPPPPPPTTKSHGSK